MRKYEVLWNNVNELSFRDICDLLDIPVVKNTIHCPAPYHEDKNPSCKIKDDKFCHCFACGFSANPLKLVRTVKGISYWEALKFIHQYTPVLAVTEQVLPEEVHLEKWELACLGLSFSPLYPVNVRTEQNQATGKNTKYKTDTISVETGTALEIINDKFIEYCATKEMFLKRFSPYAKRIINDALLGNCGIGKSPAEELWKYPDMASYRKAQNEYEARVEKYVLRQTGLHYQVISQWFEKGQETLIDRAVNLIGTKHYETLKQKIENIISMLEEKEEEQTSDRTIHAAMV